MNPVGELLGTEDIELGVDVPGKEALLAWIASMLARRNRLPQAEVLESLVARERLGSTALGHGIAIPHARMTQCGSAGGAFIRTRTAIAFDAPDGRPVSIFLGLIVPKQSNDRHLKLLATAAAMFSDRAFREKLRASVDAAAVANLFAAWPQSPAAEPSAGPGD